MISIPNPLKQIKAILPSVGLILLISMVILGLVLWGHLFYDIPLKNLTGDVTSILEMPFYIGFQSQLGIFFWAASSAICIYTSNMINNSEHKGFLLSFGLLSLLLGLDDIFLFHETLFPSIGIPQKVVVLSYGVFFGAIGLRFFKTLIRTDYILLLIAVGLFGLSILIDNFIRDASEYVTKFAEDGAKFTGIVFWFFYLYRTNYQSVSQWRSSD